MPDTRKVYPELPLSVPEPLRYALPFEVARDVKEVEAKSRLAALKFILTLPVNTLLLLYFALMPNDTLPDVLGEALDGLSKLLPPANEELESYTETYWNVDV